MTRAGLARSVGEYFEISQQLLGIIEALHQRNKKVNHRELVCIEEILKRLHRMGDGLAPLNTQQMAKVSINSIRLGHVRAWLRGERTMERLGWFLSCIEHKQGRDNSRTKSQR